MADEYKDLISKYADRYGIKPEIAQRMFSQESNLDPNAVSNKGAQGLGQLMPETARSLGVTDVNDPEQNIEASLRYLKQNLDKHNGDYSLALAAYNAGPGAVAKYNGIPPFAETQDYVKRIMGPPAKIDWDSVAKNSPKVNWDEVARGKPANNDKPEEFKPGFAEGVSGSVGMPSTPEELTAAEEAAKPSLKDFAITATGMRPATMLGGMVKDYATNLWNRGKEAVQEASEAGQNIANDEPFVPNIEKAALGGYKALNATIPLVGEQANKVGEDRAAGHEAAAWGRGLGTLALFGVGGERAGAERPNAASIVSNPKVQAGGRIVRDFRINQPFRSIGNEVTRGLGNLIKEGERARSAKAGVTSTSAPGLEFEPPQVKALKQNLKVKPPVATPKTDATPLVESPKAMPEQTVATGGTGAMSSEELNRGNHVLIDESGNVKEHLGKQPDLSSKTPETGKGAVVELNADNSPKRVVSGRPDIDTSRIQETLKQGPQQAETKLGPQETQDAVNEAIKSMKPPPPEEPGGAVAARPEGPNEPPPLIDARGLGKLEGPKPQFDKQGLEMPQDPRLGIDGMDRELSDEHRAAIDKDLIDTSGLRAPPVSNEDANLEKWWASQEPKIQNEVPPENKFPNPNMEDIFGIAKSWVESRPGSTREEFVSRFAPRGQEAAGQAFDAAQGAEHIEKNPESLISTEPLTKRNKSDNIKNMANPDETPKSPIDEEANKIADEVQQKKQKHPWENATPDEIEMAQADVVPDFLGKLVQTDKLTPEQADAIMELDEKGIIREAKKLGWNPDDPAEQEKLRQAHDAFFNDAISEEDRPFYQETLDKVKQSSKEAKELENLIEPPKSDEDKPKIYLKDGKVGIRPSQKPDMVEMGIEIDGEVHVYEIPTKVWESIKKDGFVDLGPQETRDVPVVSPGEDKDITELERMNNLVESPKQPDEKDLKGVDNLIGKRSPDKLFTSAMEFLKSQGVSDSDISSMTRDEIVDSARVRGFDANEGSAPLLNNAKAMGAPGGDANTAIQKIRDLAKEYRDMAEKDRKGSEDGEDLSDLYDADAADFEKIAQMIENGDDPLGFYWDMDTDPRESIAGILGPDEAKAVGLEFDPFESGYVNGKLDNWEEKAKTANENKEKETKELESLIESPKQPEENPKSEDENKKPKGSGVANSSKKERKTRAEITEDQDIANNMRDDLEKQGKTADRVRIARSKPGRSKKTGLTAEEKLKAEGIETGDQIPTNTPLDRDITLFHGTNKDISGGLSGQVSQGVKDLFDDNESVEGKPDDYKGIHLATSPEDAALFGQTIYEVKVPKGTILKNDPVGHGPRGSQFLIHSEDISADRIRKVDSPETEPLIPKAKIPTSKATTRKQALAELNKLFDDDVIDDKEYANRLREIEHRFRTNQ